MSRVEQFASGSRPSRRDWLRWTGWFGGSGLLSLSGGHAARGAEAANATSSPAKSCILIWLDGGPSHLESWDLKPLASSEVRGPFQPIATSVPGIAVCEHLPRSAQIAQHLAIIRSVTSPLGEHGLANHYLLTGYTPTPVLDYPHLGSVVAHERGGEPTLPPHVIVPNWRGGVGAGYLGAKYRPFVTGGDPAHSEFRVRDLDYYPGVTLERTERRREYLRRLEQWERGVDSSRSAPDPELEQAYRLVSSKEAKQAFDLEAETDATRARYGPRTLGQSCLLARRLVERGVPFVTVSNSGWDTHESLVVQLRDGYAGARVGVGLLPTLDQALAALVGDLAERGLLDETLVVAMGEFGRTPKLNARGGRDHWPRVFSVVLAGGGVPGGQVIGASDSVGESPADRPVTPADLAATIFRRMGVDPTRELQTPDGRPVRINTGGRPIRELNA